MQSVTLRIIARTSRGSTTMAISSARLRSDSSIRVRCGDGPCSMPAIPSGRALRCNLRLPAPETRVSIPEPLRASTCQSLTNTTPLDVMAHCPTRARCANPQGVLLSATLRSGLGSQGYGAEAPRRGEKRDRGSALPAVACAPAPLAPLAAPGLAAAVALLRARGPLNHHVRRLSPHNEP